MQSQFLSLAMQLLLICLLLQPPLFHLQFILAPQIFGSSNGVLVKRWPHFFLYHLIIIINSPSTGIWEKKSAKKASGVMAKKTFTYDS